MAEQDPLQTAITTVVEAPPDASPLVLDDEQLLQRFITDYARDIRPRDEIADRYGFPSATYMDTFIEQNPGLRRRILQEQAAWKSDASSELRLREYARTLMLEGLPHLAAPLFDGKSPASTKVDVGKLLARIGAVDGAPPAVKDSNGPAGNQFVLNISFAGSGRKEQITATVVDAEVAATDAA